MGDGWPRHHVRTPRLFERHLRLLASLHFFKWGIHLKLRRGRTWRHFVVKAQRGSALGQIAARHSLWVGWWESREGVRGHLNGWRLWFGADRLPEMPRDTIRIPFFPQQGKNKGREDRAA